MSVGTSSDDIRNIDLHTERPKDFNGDTLAIGDHVIFAKGRGRLAEGTIEQLGVPGFPLAVVVVSMMKIRRATCDSDGCMKVSEPSQAKA